MQYKQEQEVLLKVVIKDTVAERQYSACNCFPTLLIAEVHSESAHSAKAQMSTKSDPGFECGFPN